MAPYEDSRASAAEERARFLSPPASPSAEEVAEAESAASAAVLALILTTCLSALKAHSSLEGLVSASISRMRWKPSRASASWFCSRWPVFQFWGVGMERSERC